MVGTHWKISGKLVYFIFYEFPITNLLYAHQMSEFCCRATKCTLMNALKCCDSYKKKFFERAQWHKMLNPKNREKTSKT
jgi:hypothetical protein